jgi:hypothetical protein
MQRDEHISDTDLVLAADGELSARAAARVESHFAACWTCRARKQEIEAAAADFAREYHRASERECPPAEGPRALLRAQIEAARPPVFSPWWRVSFSGAAVLAVLALAAYLASPSWNSWQRVRAATVTVPNRNLTPGAAVFLGREEVCRAPNAKNKLVPTTLRRQVFAEYGIRAAEPRAYEVDYLITPALGGADDIHNLWPESSDATVWNASVKDALEDHLRDMVCSGEIDLATAQREIASNWIEAYKKYFHTDRPLAQAASR